MITRLRKKSVEIVHAKLPELTAYPNVITNFEVPCVMAFPPDSIRAGQTMAGGPGGGPGEVFDFGTFDVGRTLVVFTIRIYVSRTQGAGDQNTLDAYVSPDGDKSVWKIFDMNPTLDGACNNCQVVEVRNYGNWPVGSVTYLGVEIVLTAE